ncbi:MAG: hypothetical protein E7525_03695 [Ruminococcaceae bacterium]|nr:hypothetical protein [Oscillospiraceae bacterium]
MEFVNKAKEFIETLEIKTGEFIYDQKSNIQIAKVCSDLKKAYEKLGRLTYRKLKNIAVDDNEFDLAVERVEVLKMELEALRSGVYGDADSVVFEDGEPVEEPSEESNG